jgi:hypothetical protein
LLLSIAARHSGWLRSSIKLARIEYTAAVWFMAELNATARGAILKSDVHAPSNFGLLPLGLTT